MKRPYGITFEIGRDDPSGNDVISKTLAQKLHTPEVVAVFKEKQRLSNKEGR